MADLELVRSAVKLQKALDASGLMKEVSLKATKMIRQRTVRGISIHGKQFASYASSTARRKGRFRPVSLHESGRFLRNHQPIKVTGSWLYTIRGGVIPRGVRAKKLSFWHMGGTRYMPSRKYLGLTDNQILKLSRFVDSKVESIVDEVLDIDETITITLNF